MKRKCSVWNCDAKATRFFLAKGGFLDPDFYTILCEECRAGSGSHSPWATATARDNVVVEVTEDEFTVFETLRS